MEVYNSVLTLKNTPFKKKDGYKLADYYIASSFRSTIGKNQKFDYCSEKILETTIKSGARMVWLDIFNDSMSDKPKPVVCNGQKEGSWQFSLNSLSFDLCCSTIAKTAFSSGLVNNYDDPFILCLNLNTNNKLYCLRKIKNSLLKHLGSRLLGVEYGFNKINMGEVEITKLCGGDGRKAKVILMCSEGFENSDLEEIVNHSWDNSTMKKLVHKAVDPNIGVTAYIKENLASLKSHNTNNLTMITPEENTYFTRQYLPTYSFETGSQFIAMYYQKPEKFMEEYVSKFKNYSFVLKPDKLRSKAFKKTDLFELEQEQKESVLKSGDKNFSECPLTKQNTPTTESKTEMVLKDRDQARGLCFMTTARCDNTDKWLSVDSHGLHFTIDEENKNFPGFKTLDSHNINAEHNSETGSKMINTKVGVCCSKKEKIDIKNRLVLAPSCDSPGNEKGLIGLKVHKSEKERVSKLFTTTTDEGEYTWTHAKLCNAPNKSSLDNTHFCLLSSTTCPHFYDEFKVENNYKLCCKK
tara:strand:+ start:1869 stop:3437 length:1569 start_codon:yes stop_codon:yes gene_type:complete